MLANPSPAKSETGVSIVIHASDKQILVSPKIFYKLRLYKLILETPIFSTLVQ